MFNGFRVRHVSAGATALEQRFELRRNDAADVQTAVVMFAADVVSAVADEAGRPMDGDAAFWIRQAAFALVHHVWSHADVPPQGRLAVTRLSDGLLKAARAARRPA